LLYKNIEPLLRNTDHFLAYEATDWICNSIMGFVPNHWFAWKLVAQAPARSRKLWDRWGVEKVGPGLVTVCAQAHPNFLVFPKHLFYSLDGNEIPEGQFLTIPAAYGVHLWHSVKGIDSLQVWRTFPEARKYEDREWSLDELKQMAAQAGRASTGVPGFINPVTE